MSSTTETLGYRTVGRQAYNLRTCRFYELREGFTLVLEDMLKKQADRIAANFQKEFDEAYAAIPKKWMRDLDDAGFHMRANCVHHWFDRGTVDDWVKYDSENRTKYIRRRLLAAVYWKHVPYLGLRNVPYSTHISWDFPDTPADFRAFVRASLGQLQGLAAKVAPSALKG